MRPPSSPQPATHSHRTELTRSPSRSIGYLVGQWPTNWLLQRLPLAKYTAANIIVWGVVLACTAVTTDFKGLMVVRLCALPLPFVPLPRPTLSLTLSLSRPSATASSAWSSRASARRSRA